MSDRLFSCEHCRYWRRREELTDTGQCLKRAPVAAADHAGLTSWTPIAIWPLTAAYDTCGEFYWRDFAKDGVSG